MTNGESIFGANQRQFEKKLKAVYPRAHQIEAGSFSSEGDPESDPR